MSIVSDGEVGISNRYIFVDEQAILNINISDLKVGMHVILPTNWFRHPFLKNQFKLTSQKEIEKLEQCGFHAVQVNLTKSLYQKEDYNDPSGDLKILPPKKWKPDEIVPRELVQIINNKSLPPENKAMVVKESSMVLMSRLLEDPSAQNIHAAKKGIFQMVDCIISDDDTSRCLVNITSHDLYTYTHSVNVGLLSLLLAKKVFNGTDGHNMRELGAGFFLHDLGKVRIDSAILNKPGRLTEEEMRSVRRHPVEGARILAESKQLNEEINVIVMQHHEREDGGGYPRGLKGRDIHLYARICSIADVYDALHSERSYKERLNPFDSLKLMREEMMNHFQKDLFSSFVMLFG